MALTANRQYESAGAERRVLTACAHVRGSVAQALSAGEPDWDRLCALAARNGLTPLLCHALTAECPERVPPPILARLRTQMARTASANLALTAELLALLADLREAAVRVFPYKGPILAQRAYGNIALRTFVDLDLFVHRADVARALDILSARGYKRPVSFTAAQEAAFAETEYQFTLAGPRAHQVVELHWDFAWPHFSVSLDVDGLWERLETCFVAGRSVPYPAAADEIAILCVHGAKHCWERMEWIACLARIVDNNRSIDWAGLLADASARRIRRIVLLGLSLAGDLLDRPIPDTIRSAAAADPMIEGLKEEATARQFEDIPAPASMQAILGNAAFQLRTREAKQDRLRYLFHFATDPTAEDIQQLKLPAALTFVYRMIRPIRLGWKYARL